MFKMQVMVVSQAMSCEVLSLLFTNYQVNPFATCFYFKKIEFVNFLKDGIQKMGRFYAFSQCRQRFEFDCLINFFYIYIYIFKKLAMPSLLLLCIGAWLKKLEIQGFGFQVLDLVDYNGEYYKATQRHLYTYFNAQSCM